VENKVCDDDVSGVKEENVAKDAGETAPQDVDALVRPKYKEALDFAFKTLENATLKDADEDTGNGAAKAASPDGAEKEAKPKEGKVIGNDIWSRRRLPFIIGTKEFVDDDYVGYTPGSSTSVPAAPATPAAAPTAAYCRTFCSSRSTTGAGCSQG